MSASALDFFGHLLMTKVRDEAISDWRMILDGRMKGERALKLRQLLNRFSDDERQALLSVIPPIVDTVLHHVLWMLEEKDDLRLCVRVDGHEVRNLKDLSDGLTGELYSDKGWISRFSNEEK